jgi:serine/threonine-protein kinase
MASVFRAFDLELEESVALKVFDVAQSSGVLVARFKQELKLSRQLIHPNIIRLYDIGAHQGHRYISMELLVGKSLKEQMRQPIEFRTALGYLMQACHGLQAAHDAGVVHRDVKPDNFFVTEDGVLKVMDFGIAKQYETPGVTVAGSIAGTPLYMSPEQIGNFSSVTRLTDIYALGVCAYEMFTGQVPFFHADLVPLLMMHVNNPPVPPRQHNPRLPAELDGVILRLLAKDPARRYQSCRELAEELGKIRDSRA